MSHPTGQDNCRQPVILIVAEHMAELQEEQVVDYFKRAIELQDDDYQSHTNLATIYDRLNRLDEIGEHINIARRIKPGNYIINHIAAKTLRRQGQYEAALAILLETDIPEQSQHANTLYTELGIIYDLLEDADNAMASFVKANNALAETAQATVIDKQCFLATHQAFKSIFTVFWVDSWSDVEAKGWVRPAPVFLVGFPRSGTTLLNQVLYSHPAIQVMEEEEAQLSKVTDAINQLPGGYPAALKDLDKAQIEQLRAVYLEATDSMFSIEQSRILVDKFPLNIRRIGLIQRIFPDARFVLSLRHPCDVCLSCFMQTFDFNPAMVNFLALEGAAKLYEAVMGLWVHYLSVLPIQYHPIRYEDLVEDFESEVKGVLAFLDIEWDDDLLEFYNKVQSRGKIMTPSYSQVSQPIYQRTKYRWQRYDQYFEPYMQKLQPYIKLFGY